MLTVDKLSLIDLISSLRLIIGLSLVYYLLWRAYFYLNLFGIRVSIVSGICDEDVSAVSEWYRSAFQCLRYSRFYFFEYFFLNRFRMLFRLPLWIVTILIETELIGINIISALIRVDIITIRSKGRDIIFPIN